MAIKVFFQNITKLKLQRWELTFFFIPHAFLIQQKPGMDLADTYIMFVRQNQDILRDKVNEEMYIEKLFDVSSFHGHRTLNTFMLI